MGWTILPGSPSGAVEGAAAGAELLFGFEFELALDADLGFCAQGGRSDWACVKALPAKNSAGAARSKVRSGRKGFIDVKFMRDRQVVDN